MSDVNRFISPILGLILGLLLLGCGSDSDDSSNASSPPAGGGAAANPNDEDDPPEVNGQGENGGYSNEKYIADIDGFIGQSYDEFLTNQAEIDPTNYENKFNYVVFIGVNDGDGLMVQGIKQPANWEPADKQMVFEISDGAEVLAPKSIAEKYFVPGEKFVFQRKFVYSHDRSKIINDFAIGKAAMRDLVAAIVGPNLDQYPKEEYYRLVKIFTWEMRKDDPNLSEVFSPPVADSVDPPVASDGDESANEFTIAWGAVFSGSAKANFSEANFSENEPATGPEADHGRILPLGTGSYISFLPYPPAEEGAKGEILNHFYEQVPNNMLASEALVGGQFISPLNEHREDCAYGENWLSDCGYHKIFNDPAAESEYCASGDASSDAAGDDYTEEYLLHWYCKQFEISDNQLPVQD